VSDLLQRLKPRERRGSKPRCHLLTHGSVDEVAARLTSLATPFARVSAGDRWMPQGFDEQEEAQLHRAPRLLDAKLGTRLVEWWLAPASGHKRTPNFDIASTCMIGDAPGLLLVEAKAHDAELNKEAAGRSLKVDASDDRRASHVTIDAAIRSACSGLSQATSLPWLIARDTHYQMSNRFAWSWKLAALGIPVVLVYLGFLKADEMVDRGKPFASHEDWERLVKAHSEPLFPPKVWGRKWIVNGQPLIPLIRSIDQPLGLEEPA